MEQNIDFGTLYTMVCKQRDEAMITAASIALRLSEAEAKIRAFEATIPHPGAHNG
jgi:hypothetical protein